MKPRNKHQHLKLQVKRSRTGLGLFAGTAIKKGSYIIEYTGPLLNETQAAKKAGKYLFAIGTKLAIDGSRHSNRARYINHACVKTNCEPVQYARRIKFRATRNIKAGEELLYDYGKEYFDAFIGKNCRCPKHGKK